MVMVPWHRRSYSGSFSGSSYFLAFEKKQNKKKSHRLPLWYNVSYHTDKVPGGNDGSHISCHISRETLI